LWIWRDQSGCTRRVTPARCCAKASSSTPGPHPYNRTHTHVHQRQVPIPTDTHTHPFIKARSASPRTHTHTHVVINARSASLQTHAHTHVHQRSPAPYTLYTLHPKQGSIVCVCVCASLLPPPVRAHVCGVCAHVCGVWGRGEVGRAIGREATLKRTKRRWRNKLPS